MEWISTIPALSLAVASAIAGTAAHAHFSPSSQLLGPVVCRGPRDGSPRVALTFDDGPWPEGTPAILDVLADLKVSATFFVIGAYARNHPGLLARIDAEGHLVGTHSFHHHHFGVLGKAAYWDRELVRTQSVVAAQIGRSPNFFRPPMGFKNRHLIAAARRHRQTIVAWSRRAQDGVPTTTPRILQRLLPRAKPGDILMLHDGVDPVARHDPKPTIDAIRPLVLGLRQRGLEPVRLDELLGQPAYREAAGASASESRATAGPRRPSRL